MRQAANVQAMARERETVTVLVHKMAAGIIMEGTVNDMRNFLEYGADDRT